MANIYVRKSGNDSNDGSTPALAKLTIAGAISAMVSGDTIYVGSGIYREFNLVTGAKTVSIIGDVTGLYTGDAGEVIWSGLNSADTDYETTVQYAIDSNTNNCGLTIRNILFENWDFSNSAASCYIIKKETYGTFDIQNVKIRNVYYMSDICNKRIRAIYFYASTLSTVTLKNIEISGVYVASFYPSGNNDASVNFYGIYAINNVSGWNISPENIKMYDICVGVVPYSSARRNAYCTLINIGGVDYAGTAAPKNIEIYNCMCVGSGGNFVGVNLWSYHNSASISIYNTRINNIIVGTNSGSTSKGITSNSGYGTKYAYNCSVAGIRKNANVTFTNYDALTESNSTNKVGYTTPSIEKISRFSPLKGVGHTTFPTTDIEGNPRPAYGNGTACDIGAVESTSDIIQKESTIKDSGDYSIKVSPCNYFKKVFQVPVEATKLRTVKVKIRIDGTWGTYLPRVSLSGQGMTLSQDTKNSTTGSFEELTVSGTPTTTGIALLTIEAHSPNTDAAFYIDTITIE